MYSSFFEQFQTVTTYTEPDFGLHHLYFLNLLVILRYSFYQNPNYKFVT